jgi:hypothetical protein
MVRRTGGSPLVSTLSQSPCSCAGAGSPGGFCGLVVAAAWLSEPVDPASVPPDSEPLHAVSPAAESTPTAKMMRILTSG